MSKFQPPTGMHDILPDAWPWYNRILEVAGTIAENYGFSRIETPMLEDAELFARSIGAATDIVEKEMYTLKTRGGDILALKPEGTAPIARAYISNGMQSWPQPVKFWYFGPMLRHEKPQAGRYRQFWQFGLEVLGEDDAIVDAEVLQMTWAIFSALGIKDGVLRLNSLGCSQCRPYYKKVLANFYRNKTDQVCGDCRRRLKQNPLRVLDCKEERCLRVKQHAPEILDHLCENCHNHFKELLEYLEELGIPYFLNFYLVRGLDYYTRTVFEFYPAEESVSDEQGETAPKAHIALAAGGRYDDLIKKIGGKPTPAIGVSVGVERVIEVLKEKKLFVPPEKQFRVFFAQLGGAAKKKALKFFEELRRSGIPVANSFGRDSIKSQLKVADRLNVDYTLILGQQEALDGTIIVREMASGTQETVKLENLVPKLKERLRRKT